VIIATERSKRPKDFAVDHEPSRPQGCPLCGGQEPKTPPEILAYRAGGTAPNTPGWTVRVVPNKFPALMGDVGRKGEGLYDRMNGIGAHEVIVETPQHGVQLPDLSVAEVESVFWAYRDRILDLKRDQRLRYVMIFKNYGAAAGASLEHAHSQLIALPIVPRAVNAELNGAWRHHEVKERCIFCDLIRQERSDGRRLVYENAEFVVMTPYAPRFPFETWVYPKVHDSSYEECREGEYRYLADAIRQVLGRLRVALDDPPFNYILHTAPLRDSHLHHYHWHLEIMPTLSKVAGFEWGSGFYICPTPPEEAAAFLREIKIP
jgi:UDPglucose--hexose-1-phosphate uridylyltransferase